MPRSSGFIVRLLGVVIPEFTVRTEKLENGHPTDKREIVVTMPNIGKFPLTDDPACQLEIRDCSMTPEDRSWMPHDGWMVVKPEEFLNMLVRAKVVKP